MLRLFVNAISNQFWGQETPGDAQDRPRERPGEAKETPGEAKKTPGDAQDRPRGPQTPTKKSIKKSLKNHVLSREVSQIDFFYEF